MPIHELRETIQGTVTLDEEGNGYFTKRINLPDHMRNEILAIDCYNDNVVPWLVPESLTKGYQIYLSAYPVQRTEESLNFFAGALPRVGPMAGDDTVLYKETSVYNLNDFNEQPMNKVWTEKFPNDALGATQTSTFYSPPRS